MTLYQGRWKKVETIFHDALDRPVAERAAFVRARCEGDNALFSEVMTLLAADELPHRLLDARALDAVAEPESDDGAEGDEIGPYRIVRRIGSGGMGVVYLVERADGHFEQRVALKLIKRGMDSEAILARFRSERRILARLQHAGIARLLDGGVVEDGRPYFTMEYVDGMPITDYCAVQRLSLTQRLHLFRDVCGAVQYAHGNLVVHRDLKPGNILVTKDGSPKLLDFGIARVLDDPEEGLTRSGQRVMTPAYASPEQVRGEPVTTASDVYSLGLVLYEMLCGRHPHRESTSTPAEIEHAITASPAEKPSRFAPAWRRQLEGDLDTICLVALRKEPERRYASAAQMSEDLQRHLSGRTVSARSETVRYRLGKFVQRNRAGVALTTAVIVLIAVLTVFYATRLARERDLARLEAHKASEVSAFLAGLFQAADPNTSGGEAITARQMLDEGRKRVHSELAGQPEVLADLLDTIGTAYLNLGLYDEARSAFDECLALRRQVHGERNSEVVLAMVNLSVAYQNLGSYEQAESVATEAVALARALQEKNERALASSAAALALARNVQGSFDDAEPLYRESIELWRALEGPEGREMSIVENNFALMLHEASRYAEADSHFVKALDVQRKVYGERHPETVTTKYNYAQLLSDRGHLEEARAMWDEVIEAQSVLYPDGTPLTAYTLSAYGRMLLRLGEFEEAEELQRGALEVRRKYHGEEHPDVAYSLGALARVLHERARYEEAEKYYRESLAMHIATNGPRHPIVGNMMNNIGWLLYDRGEYAAAEEMHREAWEFLQSVSNGREVNAMATAMLLRAADLAALGRVVEADSLASAGTAMSRRLHGDRTTWVAGCMVGLAEIRLERGAVAEAETLFAGAIERMRLSEGDTAKRPRDSRGLIGVGRCRLAAGDVAGAEERFRDALDIERTYRRATHPEVARAEIALASALIASGDVTGAERLLRSAESALAAVVSPAHVDRREAEKLLRECR